MAPFTRLSDEQWLTLQLSSPRPGAAEGSSSGKLPLVPSDEDQLRFTGRSGAENLLQAFEFYRFAREQMRAQGPIGRRDRVLDFGCGWGRIARFWAREVEPENLWCVDCLSDAIALLKRTGLDAQILQNSPLPPIAGLPSGFRLIYAFSVFSHLSEDAANAWIEYFSRQLAPCGTLVITTRGREYVDSLAQLRREAGGSSHVRSLLQRAPPQHEIESRSDRGEFVFFPTGGGGELTEDFYGEAIIPSAYARSRFSRYGLDYCGFHEGLPRIDQAVIVFRKPA